MLEKWSCLDDMLVRMVQKHVTEIPELPQEEPELLLIIGMDSGFSVFSKTFRVDRPKNIILRGR